MSGIRLWGWFLLVGLGLSAAAGALPPRDRMAFLQHGEVCLADAEGKHIEVVTQTLGRVREFCFSPDQKYLAYARVFNYEEGPGLWKKNPEPSPAPGEKRGKPVAALVILEMNGRKVIKEIIPPRANWFYLRKWLSSRELLFLGTSGFEVWGHFIYNLEDNRYRKVYEYQGYRLVYRDRLDLDLRASGLVYVGDAEGTDECVYWKPLFQDPEAKAKRIFTSRNLRLPVFSPDGAGIAFVEVEASPAGEINHLWLYDANRQTLKKILSLPITLAEAGLDWSEDGKRLLLSSRDEAWVVPADASRPPEKIKGGQAVWGSEDRIIFQAGEDLFQSSGSQSEPALWIPAASRAVRLPAL